MTFASIPQELKDLTQWVVWKREIKDDKITKIPYRADMPMHKASSTNTKTWSTFQQAVWTLENEKDIAGIGFVFSEDDPYIGIDFDKCIAPESGMMYPSTELDVVLLSSYTEISQSGKGIHVIGRGNNPDIEGRGNKKGNIEMYSKGRYFAITGNIYPGFPSEIRTIDDATLKTLYLKHFITGPVATKPTTLAQFKSRGRLFLADEDIIEICERSANSCNFTRLWHGSTMGYSSHSEADMALCCMLAFYTRDASQLARMLRGSGLYRDKLDREDYIGSTINKALGVVTSTYEPRRQVRTRWLKRRIATQGD